MLSPLQKRTCSNPEPISSACVILLPSKNTNGDAQATSNGTPHAAVRRATVKTVKMKADSSERLAAVVIAMHANP